MSWDYIAGFFDGEGSVFDRGDGFRIQITQAHFGVLKRVAAFSGMGHVIHVKKRRAHWKESWLYYVAKQSDTLRFLKKIEPHVIVKRTEVRLAITKTQYRLAERKRRSARMRRRIRQSRILRKRGLTYREIAKLFRTDHGYIRRLTLGEVGGGRSSTG